MYRVFVVLGLLALVASSCNPGKVAVPGGNQAEAAEASQAQDGSSSDGEQSDGAESPEGDGVEDPGGPEGGVDLEPVTPEVVDGACVRVPREMPLEERCAAAGATVHEFANACVGMCSAGKRDMICAQVVTKDCKCPEGECIDDTTGCCVLQSEWKQERAEPPPE